MESQSRVRHLIAAVLIGVLVSGGLMAVTPAGAEVQAAATNWKKIWKKKLAPQADRRYYKKAASDAKYSTKTETSSAFGNYYTKAQADAKYQPSGSYAAAGSSYTKAESDAKYAPMPSIIRGTFNVSGHADGPSTELGDNLTFGWTLPSAPIAHYINKDAPVPAGCSGTYELPNASPGHLCVFEAQDLLANQRQTIGGGGVYGEASTFGAGVMVIASGAGNVYVYGSWAVRPGTAVGPQNAASSPVSAAGAQAGE